MRKLATQITATLLLSTAITSSAFAGEQTQISPTATTSLRSATTLSNVTEPATRTKILATGSGSTAARSGTLSSAIEESNTLGMLLAGVAIMALVVRRRMN